MTCQARIVAWVLLLALAGPALADEAKDKADRKAQDTQMFNTLRDVINRGADLYNNGDHSACYRLYEGALMAIRPQLEHRSGLQQSITKGFTSAERDPVMWRRAFTLRNVLDKIRDDLNPKGSDNKGIEKLGPPQIDDEDKKDEKKIEDKKPDDKKPDDDKDN